MCGFQNPHANYYNLHLFVDFSILRRYNFEWIKSDKNGADVLEYTGAKSMLGNVYHEIKSKKLRTAYRKHTYYGCWHILL